MRAWVLETDVRHARMGIRNRRIYIYNNIYLETGFHLGFFVWGGKNSLESLTTPTFVGSLYWHVINLFCTTLGY